MQNSNEEAVNEVVRLKKKCNKQLKHIDELENQLKQAKNALEEYKKSVEEKARNGSQQAAVSPGEITDVFSLSGMLFRQVFTKPIIQEALLDDRKNSPQKRPYQSLEYAVLMPALEECCSENSVRINVQKIAQNWADLGLLIRDSRGKITYNFSAEGSSVRVVRVNQVALQLLAEAWP